MPPRHPFGNPSIRAILILPAIALAFGSPPTAADTSSMPAKTCAREPVYASGEPASYEWLARIKTHANWRAKVRAMPGLGDPYANWKRAENTTERCFSGPDGTVCQFTGIPCRLD